MAAKHILLDWDGVVRANYYDINDDEPGNIEQAARLSAYPTVLFDESFDMLVDPNVLARLTAIAERPDVTIYWLTANGYIVPHFYGPVVGLPRWGGSPYASQEPGLPGAPGNSFLGMHWWKTEAALKHISDGQTSETDGNHVLWLDDSIYGDLQHHLVYGDPERRPRLSWVKPDSRLGLSSFELDLVEKWADDGEQIRWDTDRERWKAREAEKRLAHPENYED
jgi:hypothetical protein